MDKAGALWVRCWSCCLCAVAIPFQPSPVFSALVRQWEQAWDEDPDAHCDLSGYIAAKAAEWEQEACFEFIAGYPGLEHPELLIEHLCTARRQNNAAELQKQALREIELGLIDYSISPARARILREAVLASAIDQGTSND